MRSKRRRCEGRSRAGAGAGAGGGSYLSPESQPWFNSFAGSNSYFGYGSGSYLHGSQSWFNSLAGTEGWSRSSQ